MDRRMFAYFFMDYC